MPNKNPDLVVPLGARAWLFNFGRTERPSNHRKSQLMSHPTAIPTEPLKRIPGLYRRWELPEIFEVQRRYHIEEAGNHTDGTPLLAIYASDAECKFHPDAAAAQLTAERSAR
jgi:hypothetical protein